jgi:hypothetical protein
MIIKTNNSIQMASLSLLVSLLFCTHNYGQTRGTSFKKIYLQAAAGGANNNGLFNEFSIGSVLKKNWTTTLSYHQVKDMRPKNQPSDYDPGYSSFLFIPFANESPAIDMSIFSLTAGRFLKTGKNTWFNTEAGLSLVNGEKINYRRAVVDQSGLDPLTLLFGIAYSSSNYTTAKEKKTTVGTMLRTDFNWAFSSYAGIGCGAFANLNSTQSTVGFQVKLMVGWMPRKSKH